MSKEKGFVSFIIKSQFFTVPMRYDLKYKNPIILKEFFEKSKYEIKSDISLFVFQSFIKFWETDQFPKDDITIDNFVEYELLDDEMKIKEFHNIILEKAHQFGEPLIKLHKLGSSKIKDKSNIEEEISKNLDYYIKNYGNELINSPIQSLMNIFSHKKRLLTDHDISYKLIKNHYEKTNNMNILNLLHTIEFEKLNSNNQKDSIIFSKSQIGITPQIDILGLLEKIEEQSKIIEKLNEKCDLLIYNQKYNSFEHIQKNKNSLHKSTSIDDMRKLILNKQSFENGLTFLLNDENFTAELIETPKKLEELIIPNEIEYQNRQYIVTTIGNYCFSKAEISKIVIPEGVIKLEDHWYPSDKTEVIISPSNKMFKNKDSFIIGKKDINSNDYDVLYSIQRNLTGTVVIPEYIKQIGASSFGNTLIENVIFSREVEIIGQCAFSECTKLNKIEFPTDSKLQIIDEGAFCNMYVSPPIDNIIIPSSVRRIGLCSFAGCENLKTIKFLPNSNLQSIEDHAFDSTSIESISIPSSVKIIGYDVFSNSTKNINIPSDSNLQSIGSRIFTIPSNVSEINPWFYNDITTNICLEISESNQYFKYIDNKYIIGKSNKNLDHFDTLCFIQRDIEEFKVPDFITRIGLGCFSNCSIKSIIIPKQVIEIDQYSFDYSSIKYISIPSSVKNIGENAFYYCNNLKIIEITHDSELQSIKSYAFAGSSIESIFIPSKVKTIEGFAFHGCKELKAIRFSKDSQLQVIKCAAFRESSIESIIIPSTVKIIEQNAFYKCNKLRKIEFSKDSSLIEIENEAFAYSSILSFSFPSNVNKIGDSCFLKCNNLNKIEFTKDSKLVIIGNNAFESTSIEDVILAPQVKAIGDYCFKNCSKLKSFKIYPNNKLESIGKESFVHSPLQDIKSVEQLKTYI